MLEIHLIAPRFHTNLEPVVTRFLNLGHRVSVYTFSTSIAEIRKYQRDLKFFDLKSVETQRNVFVKFLYLYLFFKKNINPNVPKAIFARCEISGVGIKSLIMLVLLGHRESTVIYTQYPIQDPKPHHVIWKFVVERLCGFKYFTQVLIRRSQINEDYASMDDYIYELDQQLNSFKSYIPLAMPEIEKYSLNRIDNSKKERRYKTFVSVAKCEPRKGLAGLFGAFQETSKTFVKDWQLVVIVQILNPAHKNYYEFLEKEFNLKTSNNIKLLFNLSTHETRKLIEQSDVFILNSVREPASFSQLEALSLNIPIIINIDNGSVSLLPNKFGIAKVSNAYQLTEAMNEFSINLDAKRSEIIDIKLKLRKFLAPDVIAAKWLSKVNDNFAG